MKISPVNVTVNPDGIITVHFPDGTVPLFHILASVKLPDLITVQTVVVGAFVVVTAFVVGAFVVVRTTAVVPLGGTAVTSSEKRIDFYKQNNVG